MYKTHLYEAFMGNFPKQMPHYEHWSCPDAETYLTGIDYYQHPKRCREKLRQSYPELNLPIPEKDDPIQKPTIASNEQANEADHFVRWGDQVTWHWDWGKNFPNEEAVFNFSTLEQGDFSQIKVVESHDYRDEDALYKTYRSRFPMEWGNQAPTGSTESVGFYNTMFMWPLLTFGWDLFLKCCLDPKFERIMNEFAEINRRVFRVFSKLPVHFVICHDDIVTTQGPVCSPTWMKQYIFPRYEEYWGMLKDSGKRVFFMADGCMDAYADDVIACGADGIITEPYTDFKTLAKKYPNHVLAGEGDNRILMRQNKDEIRKMVDSMIDTGKECGGYLMCIGNHIPWDIPPESIKYYLDYSKDYAVRN